jgi:hypothetical protein
VREKKGKVGSLSLSLSLSLSFSLLSHGGICAAESEAARSTLALMVSRILLTWPADSSNCAHQEKKIDKDRENERERGRGTNSE